MSLHITKSKRNNKTYYFLDSDIKKHLVLFGESRYSDYAIHEDNDRKANYLSRHGKCYHSARFYVRLTLSSNEYIMFLVVDRRRPSRRKRRGKAYVIELINHHFLNKRCQ